MRVLVDDLLDSHGICGTEQRPLAVRKRPVTVVGLVD